MAIGARDVIDQLLVKKYADEKVDGKDNMTSMIAPEKVMSVMNDYASMQANLLNMNSRLYQACSSFNARAAKYRNTRVATSVQ